MVLFGRKRLLLLCLAARNLVRVGETYAHVPLPSLYSLLKTLSTANLLSNLCCVILMLVGTTVEALNKSVGELSLRTRSMQLVQYQTSDNLEPETYNLGRVVIGCA